MPRALAAAACLALALALACASAPRVDVDPAYDWRGAASWDWLPPQTQAAQGSDLELRARIGQSIEQQLDLRGLVRSGAPDLLVASWIALAREQVVRTETPAQSFLPSFHAASPSYEITASRRHTVVYERVAFAIEVFDAGTRALVWRGLLEERRRGSFAERAPRAVADLLSRFPLRAAPALRAPAEVASAAPDPGTHP
jgi:hypothetical protein